jgi:hypothetical protein
MGIPPAKNAFYLLFTFSALHIRVSFLQTVSGLFSLFNNTKRLTVSRLFPHTTFKTDCFHETRYVGHVTEATLLFKSSLPAVPTWWQHTLEMGTALVPVYAISSAVA